MLNSTKIGQIFTPIPWARWLIDRWNIFDQWCSGARICDPTAGQGAFALALFEIANDRCVTITKDMLSRLSLIEIDSDNLATFKEIAKVKHNIDFPESQLIIQDVITSDHVQQYDILIGNPPWANFTDLPAEYKECLKPHFISEGLVPDRKKMLLGSSRIDISALVLKIVLGKMLTKNGLGCFFIPISLFFGDGAHTGFRNYVANGRNFSVTPVYEFTESRVFEDIGTAYCCAKFRIDTQQTFPVRYFRENNGTWVELVARPLKKPDDQWRVLDQGDEVCAGASIEVPLSARQKPRQGVNTCGANAVFIFDEKPRHLPEDYLFPLATKELWRGELLTPIKWILLPYEKETGRPLSWPQIDRVPSLRDYLLNAKDILERRKGTLIQSAIAKGFWWSLFGVGPYSFAPSKVMWQAFGKSDFAPVLLTKVCGQVWQGNQAMHAFIPCWTETNAKHVLSSLQNPDISKLLKQLNGGGKCNWAQPGKISKILFA